MKILATISVVVDEVDYEQECIKSLQENGRKITSTLIYINAALAKEELSAMRRICLNNNHAMDFRRLNVLLGFHSDAREVRFIIYPKPDNQGEDDV